MIAEEASITLELVTALCPGSKNSLPTGGVCLPGGVNSVSINRITYQILPALWKKKNGGEEGHCQSFC